MLSVSPSTSSIIEATILGCGSSGGVPRIGNIWGDCDPNDPLNRRTRCSMLLRRQGDDGETTVLIDTGPDMRAQLLQTNVNTLDGVLYTHGHADHIHGIDDLRAIVLNTRRKIDVYFDEITAERMYTAFAYCFETPPGSNYPPILNEHLIHSGDAIEIQGLGGPIPIKAIAVEHGDINALAFRIGDCLYCPDVSNIPPSSLADFCGLDTLILDALRPRPHPSHLSLEGALEWIDRLQPKHAILTNMHIDLDYQSLKETLPDHIEPAYDGMVINIQVKV